MIDKGNSVLGKNDWSALQDLLKLNPIEEPLDPELELELLEIQMEDARIQMEQNDKLLKDLEEQRKDAALNHKCLSAIGQKKSDEGNLDYAARAMASYPALMDDMLPVADIIQTIPEEGVPIDENMKGMIRQQVGEDAAEKVIQKMSEYAEDGVITRIGVIKMYGDIGNGLDDVAVTPDQIKAVQETYQEKFGVRINDQELLTGLTRVENAMREASREVVQEYLKNNPKPVEAACEPFWQKQTPQPQDTGFKP